MPGAHDDLTMTRSELVEFFTLHQRELSGTVRHALGPGIRNEDAEEAIQNAFLQCWKSQLGHVEDLRGFVFVAVLNAARDLLRRRGRRREISLDSDRVTEVAMPLATTDPLAALERKDALASVSRAIGALGPEEREVFLLRQNGDLTYERIARALEIPVGTAKTRMRRALAQLRSAVAHRSTGEGSK